MIRPAVLLVAVVVHLVAAEGWDPFTSLPREPRPQFTIDNFPVHPGGNQDEGATAWLVHPFAMVAGGVSGSIGGEEDAGWDPYARVMAGLGVAWFPQPEAFLRLQGMGGQDMGPGLGDSRWRAGFEGQAHYTGPWWDVDGSGAWRRTRDPTATDYQYSLKSDGSARVGWTRTGPGLAPAFDAEVRSLTYAEDTVWFSAAEGSRTEWSPSARLGWRTSAGTLVGAVVTASRETFATRRIYGDHDDLRLGLHFEPATFLTDLEGSIEAGVQRRSWDSPYRGDPSSGPESVLRPWLAGTMLWSLDTMTDLKMDLTQEVRDGRSANGEVVSGLAMAGRFRWRRNAWWWANTSLEHTTDLGATGRSGPIERNLGALTFGYGLQVWRGVGLRLRVTGSHAVGSDKDPSWGGDVGTDLVAAW